MARRSFYEDDSDVVTTPGLATPIPDDLRAQEGVHGEVSFVDGMTVRSSPILEQYANSARLYVHDKWTIISAEWATQRLAFRQEWNSIRSYIGTDLVRDPVLPNGIYVLTATLLGSVAVLSRALPVRFLAPVVCGAGALAYAMPRTFDAVVSEVDALERQRLPEMYAQQQALASQWTQWKHDGEQLAAAVEHEVENGVHRARAFVKDLFK